MNLEKWRAGINKSIENVKDLFKDAGILMNNKSFTRACFFFISAFEELAVAYFIMDNFDKPKPKKLKNFLNHRKKLSISSFMSFAISMNYELLMRYLDTFKKLNLQNLELDSKNFKKTDLYKFGEELQKAQNLMYFRNRSIYISLNQSLTNFTCPRDIETSVAQKFAVQLYYNLISMITTIQIQRDMFFEHGYDKSIIFDIDEEYSEILESLSKIIHFLKVVDGGSIEKIREFKGISQILKDSIVEIILNPNKIKDPDIYQNVIVELLKDLADKYYKISKDEKSKKKIDYYIKKLDKYNPLLAGITKNYYMMLQKISEGTFKIEDFLDLSKLGLKTSNKLPKKL